ncbi:hypothetical protein LCGC14_3027060, partial [marine sediment metagenome]
MAYADKDKQREASRERQRRYKARQKALPERGVTFGAGQKIADATVGKPVPDLPANFGQPDCECLHCQQQRSNKSGNIIN